METLKKLLPQVLQQARGKHFEITEMPRQQAEERFAVGVRIYSANVNAKRPKEKPFDFKITDENEQVISDLIDYFRFASTGNLDITKGIYLAGNPGSGKSALMEIFSHCKFPGREFNIRQNMCQLITERFIKEGFDGIYIFVKPEWKGVYDDLGVETIGKYFGNQLMVMSYVIQQAYQLWQKESYKPLFTSNLSLDQLENIYEARCESRMREMCNVVYLGEKMESKDWRKI